MSSWSKYPFPYASGLARTSPTVPNLFCLPTVHRCSLNLMTMASTPVAMAFTQVVMATNLHKCSLKCRTMCPSPNGPAKLPTNGRPRRASRVACVRAHLQISKHRSILRGRPTVLLLLVTSASLVVTGALLVVTRTLLGALVVN